MGGRAVIGTGSRRAPRIRAMASGDFLPTPTASKLAWDIATKGSTSLIGRDTARRKGMEIRQLITIEHETWQEAGRAVAPPTRKVAACAVIANPLAGRPAQD